MQQHSTSIPDIPDSDAPIPESDMPTSPEDVSPENVSTSESAVSQSAVPTSPEGKVLSFQWSWKKQPLAIAYETWGEGRPILLLPALSSVSSRDEMRGLAERLAADYQVVVPDWVGFGESARPALDYDPKIYHKFLRDFVTAIFQQPVVVIAAGHGAGYVMQLAQQKPAPWSWVVLVAPTWRGPLPTAMGDRHRPWYNFLRRLVRTPLLGQFLYALNVSRPFLGWMYRRHVYADAQHISRSLMRGRAKTARQRGARFASAAFVTGALDPIRTRAEFFDYFQPLPLPTLLVIGEQTPPKSLEEMEVIAHFSQVQSYRMPGSLGLHEEYPDELVAGILPFLKKYLS
ncbi:MAG: alpha/beta hydrolase [Oculatellaceae cyanobacterium Prado106]|jgi:pimeloyl-ACP methyl ester carboxylesterase|nr:alpha/beta hydrolase [Oculatellaceae cyanobacterium Prado106]